MSTRVTTTVLFTDLVGSTALASSMGRAEADELRQIHFGLLREAIERTGGVEVKNLGDGLMVAFSSLSASLDAAVAMQQNLARHNRRAELPLAVRIGISNGDADLDDGDYFGEPVIEAARLCALAAGGQILTTDLVRSLARRSGHRFDPVGALDLKGLPEPVEACALNYDPIAAETRQPIPRRLAIGPAAGLVGREAERDLLTLSRKSAFASDGHRIALLSGEPGIGKTTLAGDAARAAHEDGATVLYGRCDEELGVPYQPFVEALGELLSGLSAATLSGIEDRHLSELARLVPEARQRIPALDVPSNPPSDAEQYLLFNAVTAVVVCAAAADPLLLVLDDLHWADKPTVLLLRHLAATLDGAQVMVIGTYRDTDLDIAQPLTEGLAALRREPSVERITLDGLDDLGVVAMLEGLAGHSMGDDGIELAHAVRRETEGNPFFTGEVVRHLAETDALRQDEHGRWIAAVDIGSMGLPESVREVVGQRIHRLGADVGQVLTVASVVGRDFDVRLLALAAERDEIEILEALEVAAERGVVAEVDGYEERYTFTHALFQHTLYDGLSSARRGRLHRHVGELLEQSLGADPGDRIGELAHHWVAATRPADIAKAVTYTRRAGLRALQSLAPEEAIRWFTQTLELVAYDTTSEPTDRVDALIGLGDAQRQAGDPAFRQSLLDAASEALELHDGERLVAAALANHRGMVSSVGVVDPDRIAVLEHALVETGHIDSPTAARLLAALAAELSFSGDLPRVRALADEAEQMARRLEDDLTLLYVLNVTFLALCVPDAYERITAVTAELAELAERTDDPVADYWASINRVYGLAHALDGEGVDATLAHAWWRAGEIGQPYMRWHATYLRATHALRVGDHERAEELNTLALQVGTESGQPDAFVSYGAILAGIRRHQGRLDEILPIVEQVAGENPGLAALRGAQAMVLCECGRIDDARALVERARRDDFYDTSYNYVWLTSTTVWADVAAWLEHEEAAEVLLDRLVPHASLGVVSGSSCGGVVAAYLARLAVVVGRHEDAHRYFEQADQALRRPVQPMWLAANQYEWARLLGTSSGVERVRARGLLDEALVTAREFGCGGIEARVLTLASALS